MDRAVQLLKKAAAGARDGTRRVSTRGFTLLEASMTLVILGVGVMAFVEAQSSFMDSNGWSSQAATATYLANELRERMRKLSRHDPVNGLVLNGATVVGWGRDAGETTIDDLDDIDDFDGLRFGADGNMPGPVNAWGDIIPELDQNGAAVVANGQPVALRGWSQEVTVEKVDPNNNTTVRTPSYSIAASGGNPGRAMDKFPLRVKVTVYYRGPLDSSAREITHVRWIVPE
jgi:prepilin-type N-terminal cleavage/methylation domain-containing protein